jgi:hypothetical protein
LPAQGIELERLVRDVREFIQDDPRLNVLIRKLEFGDALIKLAVRMMVDEFNHINWRSNFEFRTFPPHTTDIQLYGTIFHLMNSGAILQTRNHLPYNDAGLSVAQFAKSGEYTALANQFGHQFKQSALNLKYQMNLEMGWGGVSSEYAYYGGYAFNV